MFLFVLNNKFWFSLGMLGGFLDYSKCLCFDNFLFLLFIFHQPFFGRYRDNLTCSFFNVR